MPLSPHLPPEGEAALLVGGGVGDAARVEGRKEGEGPAVVQALPTHLMQHA